MRTPDYTELLESAQRQVHQAEEALESARADLAAACARANMDGGLSFSAIGSVLDVSKQHARKLAASSDHYVAADAR